MTSKVLDIQSILNPAQLATRIVEKWQEWDLLRRNAKTDWEEIRRYVFATDTTKTTNHQLPWKNKTTIPKLCQIRDNLYSNYTSTLWPQRKWLIWEAGAQDAASRMKKDAITNYMNWVIEQQSFKDEMDKIILDYIDYGNCFATVEWLDERVERPEGVQAGYVGPVVRRISPLDIVFNPTAEDFRSSPKIVRTIMNMGEVRELLQRMTPRDDQVEIERLWDYLKNVRAKITSFSGDMIERDNLYAIEGFSSFRNYMKSDFCEVLTFYGDIYDWVTNTFYKNHVITCIDRHMLIGNKPNPSFFAKPPIFHSPWRKRQDNIWGMGPLDNLVGMQYRLDHIENMKADVLDLVTYPVQKIKGYVEDYTWQPGEKIWLGDEGDVEMVVPDISAAQPNMELDRYERWMEEIAGAPREAMGFRTPGEKTKYEVQSLENASARIFQNKIQQFEEQIIEPLLNAMLEMARRNMQGTSVIKVFDDDLKIATFQTLTVEDITGIGRIRPIAARHFAEQAQLIQNLTGLTNSPLWQTVAPHFSGIGLAKVLEDNFDIKDYNLVMPFIAATEQMEGQRMMQQLQQQVLMEAQTATGAGEDYDMKGQQPMELPPGGIQQ